MKTCLLFPILLMNLFQGSPMFLSRVVDLPLNFPQKIIKGRKTMVITNPYATSAGSQFMPSNAPNVRSPVSFSPATSSANMVYSFPIVAKANSPSLIINPYTSVSSLVTSISPTNLVSNLPSAPSLNSYHINGVSYTNVPMSVYQNLQARNAANTLQSAPLIGNNLVDGIVQRTNTVMSGLGNTANMLLDSTSRVATTALNGKSYLTQQNAALNTNSFAVASDTANQISQINQAYNSQLSSIQAQAAASNLPANAATQAASYFTSSYGTGFKKLV